MGKFPQFSEAHFGRLQRPHPDQSLKHKWNREHLIHQEEAQGLKRPQLSMQPGSTSLRLPRNFAPRNFAPFFHPQRPQELWEKSCQVTGKNGGRGSSNTFNQHGLLECLIMGVVFLSSTNHDNPTNTYEYMSQTLGTHLMILGRPGRFRKNALLDLDIMTRRAKQQTGRTLEIVGCNLAMLANGAELRLLH